MALELSSLGADPTEQKVFKRSNRQVESRSRRTRVLLAFMECQAAPSEPYGLTLEGQVPVAESIMDTLYGRC